MVEQIKLLYNLMPQTAIERTPRLIEPKEIKAILYLGLRGEITLPVEDHEVDILA